MNPLTELICLEEHALSMFEICKSYMVFSNVHHARNTIADFDGKRIIQHPHVKRLDIKFKLRYLHS